ncbi:MAG TPA: hypothetical protein VMT61_15125 [Candidatus Binataceae bacterium]|nr:hypothetical protein [Candidatus Binataceae bacterium]
MIPSKQLLSEVIASLRNVIAPAVKDPYPKSQAYMAAVILEFLARQLEERTDIESAKEAELASLFGEVARLAGGDKIKGGDVPSEAALCGLIERLYNERERLGEDAFKTANGLVRASLRRLLDQELKITGKSEA